jgi:hypothetical protein
MQANGEGGGKYPALAYVWFTLARKAGHKGRRHAEGLGAESDCEGTQARRRGAQSPRCSIAESDVVIARLLGIGCSKSAFNRRGGTMRTKLQHLFTATFGRPARARVLRSGPDCSPRAVGPWP